MKKINKTSARLTKKKEGRLKLLKQKIKERKSIPTYRSKNNYKEYHEQLYANKLHNLDEMDRFSRDANYQN